MGITPPRPVMTPDESAAWRKVSKSMKFENDRYVVAVPWRDDRPSLPNNRPLAEKRLELTERKLTNSRVLSEGYRRVFGEEVHSSSSARPTVIHF